jgi:hypothetical protein
LAQVRQPPTSTHARAAFTDSQDLCRIYREEGDGEGDEGDHVLHLRLRIALLVSAHEKLSQTQSVHVHTCYGATLRATGALGRAKPGSGISPAPGAKGPLGGHTDTLLRKVLVVPPAKTARKPSPISSREETKRSLEELAEPPTHAASRT